MDRGLDHLSVNLRLDTVCKSRGRAAYEDMTPANTGRHSFPTQIAKNAQGKWASHHFRSWRKSRASVGHISLFSMMPASPSRRWVRGAGFFIKRTPGPPCAVSPSPRKATPAISSAHRIATSLPATGTRLPFSKSRTVPSLRPALAPSLTWGQSKRPLAARHCSGVSGVTNFSCFSALTKLSSALTARSFGGQTTLFEALF